MMRKIRVLVALMGLCVTETVAAAGSPEVTAMLPKKGYYMSGGGVGIVKCTEFLNDMSTARQLGGLGSIGGSRQVYGYGQFVLGFQTAYNASVPGLIDIFDAFGGSPSYDVLYGLEPWCSKHPEEDFATALVVFAENIKKRHGFK